MGNEPKINTQQLKKEIIGENFNKALEMILSMEIPEEEDLTKPK